MFSFAKKLKDKLEGGASTDSDSYFHTHLSRNNGGYGLRVLYVKPDSKALELGFESWFDYIVGVNGHVLPMRHVQHAGPSYSIGEDGLFNYGDSTASSTEASIVDFDLLAQELGMAANGPDKTIIFEVWSAKGGVLRYVSLPLVQAVEKTPQTAGNSQKTFRLYENVFEELGTTVVSQHLSTSTHVWRILNTHPHSPAFHAQLAPFSDYIIGCDSAFPTDIQGKGLLAGGGEQRLAKAVSEYYIRHQETLQDDKIPVILYIYNHDCDSVRPVTVYLSRAWSPGGPNKGILGCDVGYGFLHRLPAVPGKFESTTELMGENDKPKTSVAIPTPPVKTKASNRYAPVPKPEAMDVDVFENKEAAKLVQATPVMNDFKEISVDSKIPEQVQNFQEKNERLTFEQNKKKTEETIEPVETEVQMQSPKQDVFLQKEREIKNATNLPTQLNQLQPGLHEENSILEPGTMPANILSNFVEIDEPADKATEKVELNLGELSLEEVSEFPPPKKQTDDFTEVPLTTANQKDVAQDFVPGVGPVQENDHTLKPQVLSKIDSLLDEDEDFLEEDLSGLTKPEPEPEIQNPAITEDVSMREIPLSKSANEQSSIPPVLTTPLSPARISQPAQNINSPVFSPMRQALPLSPPATGAPIGKPGRRRKPHGPANLGNLADFMNEELSKSKAHDQNYNATNAENGSEGVPPPPPKSVKR